MDSFADQLVLDPAVQGARYVLGPAPVRVRVQGAQTDGAGEQSAEEKPPVLGGAMLIVTLVISLLFAVGVLD